MQITVYGLWHLGCVTAACLAEAGNRVMGLDLDEPVVADLKGGKPPLFEPGLEELIRDNMKSGRLAFTTDPAEALRDAEVVWVAFDTPVNDRDEADLAFLRGRLESIADHIAPGTLVLISSQAPAGFTAALAADWSARGLHYAYSPENLRLGKALDVFRHPERVIVGLADPADKPKVEAIFAPFSSNIVWMSVASAEMTKHALNAFLATSVTFINELARLCEAVGADAKEVERGLKSEARIGPKAYLAPGAAFAGGTLARDVRFLIGFGEQHRIDTPLFNGILASNERHKGWMRETVGRLLKDVKAPTVAVLGLTYKPGTDTLRRSAAVELCRWLHAQQWAVQAHDPAVKSLPEDLRRIVDFKPAIGEALAGADLAVIATEWPHYKSLASDDFVAAMRTPRVIDQNWFLSATLAGDSRIVYIAPGRSQRRQA